MKMKFLSSLTTGFPEVTINYRATLCAGVAAVAMTLSMGAEAKAVDYTAHWSNSAVTNIMPSFAGAPTGWTSDRFDPNSFTDIGTFEGRSNVLQVGITSAEGGLNRPAGKQGSLFSTQGMQHTLTGGVGSVLSADLFVPLAWASEANGSVRTEILATMSDVGFPENDYPAIGFTNESGTGTFRYFDPETGKWNDIMSKVAYDDWTSLSITLALNPNPIDDPNQYIFAINGIEVYSNTFTNYSTSFQDVAIQAYNFYDVPEPASLLLLTAGVAGLARIRASKKA
jgi:hypothetical protein